MNRKIYVRIFSLVLSLIMIFMTPVSSFATAGIYSKNGREEVRKAVVDNIVEIAKSQIGFYEGDINKFTTWYYGRETESSWCCIFVSWCASQAGVIDSAIPQRASCDSMRNWFRLHNQYYPLESGYVPQKGDIVFYNVDVDGTDNVNHIEIVTEEGFQYVGKEIGVKSIGGNTSNLKYQGCQYVMEKFRAIESNRAQIVGFCHPSYHKAESISGKILSFSEEIRNGDMRYIHSKYISLIYHIEMFWQDFFKSFDNIIIF